jgi:hypothetical protein
LQKLTIGLSSDIIPRALFDGKSMQRLCVLLVLVVFNTPFSLAASDKAVLGSWEGDSKCIVADSPCHDEHVLYQITEDKRNLFQLNLDAYKVVEGNPEFIGTLACSFEPKAGVLSCTSSTREKDDWEFHIMGKAMSGRLMIDDGKTLYRRIVLHKAQDKN